MAKYRWTPRDWQSPGVNPDGLVKGAADFSVDLDEHIQFVIDAMKAIAAELELLHRAG